MNSLVSEKKKKELQDLINKKNLQDKIKFVGELNDKKLRVWINSLNLYVQATRGEGMSTSVLKALASKIPTIGSNVNGNREILGRSYARIKLFENSYNDLTKKILFFYNNLNKNKIIEFTKIDFKYVYDQHRSSIIKKKYLNLLDIIN